MFCRLGYLHTRAGQWPGFLRCYSTSKPDVVMVTGGNGFLGQHLIKLLHERTSVNTIVVFDVKPFQQKLDYKARASVKVESGDVRSINSVVRASEGCDTVIHAASLIQYGPNADYARLFSINVKGTENVIEACVRNNIERLVYTSSSFVRVGLTPVSSGDERLPRPQHFLLPLYSQTKCQAENTVIAANGIPLPSGGKLHTIAIRPGSMYGEGDENYISGALKNASKANGVVYSVGDKVSHVTDAYVGNVAWGHLAAMDAMVHQEDISGTAYFIADHPAINPFDLIEIIASQRGFTMHPKSFPYKPIYFTIAGLEVLAKLLKPFLKLSLPTNTSGLQYICSDYVFHDDKFRQATGYVPLYSFDECIARSLQYYNIIDLGN